MCAVCTLVLNLLSVLLSVACIQTLMCLELWVKVLAAAASKGTLQPLVYPTTQLLLGAARLVPTPRYFPIRLRLVRDLNKLAQVRTGGTQCFIRITLLSLHNSHLITHSTVDNLQ